jgi:hypothetical protein
MFRVLPSKATFYLALCECQVIEHSHFYEATDQYTLISDECYCNKNEENYPYDSFYLNELRDGYELLSEPLEAFTVDFNDIELLRKTFLSNQFHKQIKLNAAKSGRMSAVVGWFR